MTGADDDLDEFLERLLKLSSDDRRLRLRKRRQLAGTVALRLMPVGTSAQELEPGAYWPIPRGLNIVTAVNSVNWGDLAFDPSAPIDEASAFIVRSGADACLSPTVRP